VISAVLAALTALAGGGSWAWQQLSEPDSTTGAGTASAAPSAPAASPGPEPTTATTPAGTAPAAGPGTPLDTITRIGGAVAALPDEVAATDYARPVVVACPSNDTGDQARTLTYDLDRRFRTFTATVSGWAEARDPDPIEVRIYTKTRQPDDTFRTVEAAAQRSIVNQAGQALSAKVTGADHLLVEVACHRPGGVVILDAAAVSS
jgi:hypothetical protein